MNWGSTNVHFLDLNLVRCVRCILCFWIALCESVFGYNVIFGILVNDYHEVAMFFVVTSQ
jgi:hypothetical protein